MDLFYMILVKVREACEYIWRKFVMFASDSKVKHIGSWIIFNYTPLSKSEVVISWSGTENDKEAIPDGAPTSGHTRLAIIVKIFIVWQLSVGHWTA